jgi:hypothetical protein
VHVVRGGGGGYRRYVAQHASRGLDNETTETETGQKRETETETRPTWGQGPGARSTVPRSTGVAIPGDAPAAAANDGGRCSAVCSRQSQGPQAQPHGVAVAP